MRLVDLIALIAENLNRRKGRVALTAIGVVIGTAAVVVLVSLAIGLQTSANQRLGGIGDLTQIQVYPNFGMEGGMGMAVAVEPGGKGSPTGQTNITPARLQEIEAIPGVVNVITRDYLHGGGMIKYAGLETWANLMGLSTHNLGDMGYDLQQGTLELQRGTAIIGSEVTRNFMNPRQRPGQAPPDPPDLYDQQIKIELQRWTQDGQMTTKIVTLRVVGVLSQMRNEADYSIIIPMDDLTPLNEWFDGRRVNRNRDGYNMAVVKVDDVDNVLEVADQIKTIGLQAETPQAFVEGINSFFVVLQVIFGGVGAVALLVAAIGIANTMTMAILERTREIGLMKAIGATNRDVLSVFLGEAAGIGLLGGVGGALIGWSGGQVVNVLLTSYMANQAAQQGGLPSAGQSIVTPVWLLVFGVAFATLVGLLSGLYPALRAATLVPVNALKYE